MSHVRINDVWADGGSGRITAAGASLECASWGPAPGAAPTILLLHEGLGCVALWRDFPAKLAEATGCGVLAYSRAGYGRSDPAPLPWPLDYMTREAIDVLPEVLDRTGFERGILMGHSDGATIAAIHAGSVPDRRVRGLCLMAPHFFPEETGLAAIAAARTAFDNGDLRNRLTRYHADAENAFRGWNDVWLDPRFKGWNASDAIDYWRIPVLAIQGLQDPYGTLAQIDEIDRRIHAPLETVILDDCRHSPHLDQPNATLAAIQEFVRRLERLERENVKVA